MTPLHRSLYQPSLKIINLSMIKIIKQDDFLYMLSNLTQNINTHRSITLTKFSSTGLDQEE